MTPAVERVADHRVLRWGFFATQLQAILLCGVFASWGFGARRTDPAAHKRLMILATITILSAAFGRMVNATRYADWWLAIGRDVMR